MLKISLSEWQAHFGTEKSCEKMLAKVRWPNGFFCPRCNSKVSSYVITRKKYQCSVCRYQVSITAGTLFHSTNLPLVKWFRAIYHTAADPKGISPRKLSQAIHVSWPTAGKMLKKIGSAMDEEEELPLLFIIKCLVHVPEKFSKEVPKSRRMIDLYPRTDAVKFKKGGDECCKNKRQSGLDGYNIDGLVKSPASRHPGEGRGPLIRDATG